MGLGVRKSDIIFENIIISSVIFLFIWISFFSQPFREMNYFLTNTFLLIVFLIILIRNKLRVFSLKDIPLWVFVIAIGVNVSFASQKNITVKTYVNLAIPMFVIYYTLSKHFLSEKKLYLLANVICICSIAVCLLAVFETIFAFNPVYKYLINNQYYMKYTTGFIRPMSTQFDATALGGFLLGCFPFSFILFQNNTSSLKLLGAIGVILNTVTIILTLSRGAFLGLVLMIVFFLAAEKKYRFMRAFLITMLIFLATASYFPYPFSKLAIGGIISGKVFAKSKISNNKGIIEEHALAKGYDLEEFGSNWIYEDSILSNYRLERLSMALRMLKDHPFKGLGFQHFRLRFYEYYPYKQKIPYDITVADNMYLTILAETGIIGFLGFFIFIISLFRKGWMKFNELSNDPGRKWLLMAGLMAFIGLLINMAGYELFYWINQYTLFCIIIGFINAASNNFEPEERLNNAKA